MAASCCALRPRHHAHKLDGYFQTPAELAEEAMKALRESPREHFARLVRLGWINRQGEVTRLLGGDAEPEPDSEPGHAALTKTKKRRRRRA